MPLADPVRVTIKSFQSIDELDFEISGFTCVTGPTNIGKSAVIRAISSALLNSSVVGSVRKGRKFCTVDVRAPGWGVKWEKGERVGRYWVPGEEKPRDGIGQGQTEMTASLGFRAIKVGDKYINPWLAGQFQPIFLLDQSGPSITDFISDITRLSVLQDAVVLNSRGKQKAMSDAFSRDAEAQRLTESESRFDPLDGLTRAETDILGQVESLRACEESASSMAAFDRGLESESELVRRLSEVKQVSVPEAVPDGIAEVRKVIALWASVEEAAIRVARVRAAASIPVPGVLPHDPMKDVREAARFLPLCGMEAVIASLESSLLSLFVPEAKASVGPEIAGAKDASALLARVSSAESSVAALSGDLPGDPDLPAPDFLKDLLRASELSAACEAESVSIESSESKLRKLLREIEETESELAKIPTCPTCKQVVARTSHAHPSA